MIKKLLKILLATTILVLSFFYLIHRPCPENRGNDPINKNDYILKENSFGMKQLDYVLLDNEKVLYRYNFYPGHQGCWDVGYRYSGKILINEERYKIKLKDRMPAFVGLYKDEIYLLTKHYIHDDWYIWYKANQKKEFLYLKRNLTPSDFSQIKFKSKKVNYLYMVDVLDDMLRDNFDQSITLLKGYIKDVDRFAFLRAPGGVSGIEGYLRSAMKEAIANNKREELLEIINQILIKYPESEATSGIRNYSLELLFKDRSELIE